MTIAFVIAFILNGYMIFLLIKLKHRDDFNFSSKFSFHVIKAINYAIDKANTEETKRQLIKLKNTYILILLSFFIGLLLFSISVISLNVK